MIASKPTGDRPDQDILNYRISSDSWAGSSDLSKRSPANRQAIAANRPVQDILNDLERQLGWVK